MVILELQTMERLFILMKIKMSFRCIILIDYRQKNYNELTKKLKLPKFI